MPAYVIVDIEVHDPVAYEKYKAAAQATVGAYGGRYLVRGGRVETLEGSWTPRRFVVLEFPSFERARAWWSSPEYAAAKAIRHASAATEMIVADGVPVQA